MVEIDLSTKEILNRVLKVERQNKVLKVLFIFSLSAILLSGVVQDTASSTGEVEARRFVLRDAKGVVRAVLAAPDGEQGGLTIFDENERPRLFVGIAPRDRLTPGGPIIGFYPETGRLRYQTSLYQTAGQGVLVLRDSTFRNSISLATTKLLSSITFWQRDSKTERITNRGQIKVTDATTFATMNDALGRPLWSSWPS